MRNIKLLIEYDGTNYVGWQRQAAGRSIQEEIERVLSQILQETIIVAGAGRTDAGVHARAQVANFPTEGKLSLREIKGGLIDSDSIVTTFASIEGVPVVEPHAAASSAIASSVGFVILLSP